MLFTNIPLDELEEDSGSLFTNQEDNEVCYLCSQGFSLMNKKYNCSNCKMPICIKNSIFFDQKSRICDNCRHESLVDEVWSEKKQLKDQIIRNMQRSIREAAEKEDVIKSEELRIENLIQELEEIKRKAETEEGLLEIEIEKIRIDNNSVEKEIKNIVGESEQKQSFEMVSVDKIARAHEMLQITRIEIEEAVQEGKELEVKVLKCREKRATVDLEELKKIICRICWSKISNTPHRRKLGGQEISSKICNCIAF